MKQTYQGMRYTKRQHTNTNMSTVPPVPPNNPSLRTSPPIQANELHVYVEPISKFYIDDTDRLPVCSRRRNQYILIAHQCDSNATPQAQFNTKKDTQRIDAYTSIIKCLKYRDHVVELQILDNRASAKCRRVTKEEWHIKFQLVPSDVHCCNAAERAIQMFKAHFHSILAGVDPNFPKYLWDILLDQTETTLNLLQKSTLDPSISTWEYFNAPHSYDATPLGLLGCKISIQNKPKTRKSWDFRACDGFNIGPAFHHYRCFHIMENTTKALLFSDTIELCHSHLTQPYLTSANRITHALSILTCALKDLPTITCNAQLYAISNIKALFGKWQSTAANPS